MKKQTILVKKLDPRAILPIYSSQSAAGADLFALAEAPIEIAPGETVRVRTGLAVEIPEGCCGLIYARSGMATNGLVSAIICHMRHRTFRILPASTAKWWPTTPTTHTTPTNYMS